MQDVTPWPESFDVSEPVARVLVDGELVEVESVSVSSELDSAAPDRVAAGGGGVVAATGSASILPFDDVSEAGANPWGNARAFVNATEVVVEAGYRDAVAGGVGCARQLTGQVESLDGSAANIGVGLGFVDYTTLLDRDITIEPLLQEYPPLEDGDVKRGAGLSPLYVTNRVLRYCGFFATPPMIDQAFLSAPLMGSAIPERGTLVTAAADSHPDSAAAFRPVPWGLGLGNGVLTYAPTLGVRGHGRLTSTLHVSFHRARSTYSSPGDSRIDVRWGSANNSIRVTAQANGTLVVRYIAEGSFATVAIMPAADVNASEAFTVLVTPFGRATIYASNGATATGEATLPHRAQAYNMDEVYVQVDQAGHLLGGLQVAFSDTTNHYFTRRAHLEPVFYDFYAFRAFPAQIGVNCLSLLKEQAAAELAAMWIDEFGHFHWRNRHHLRESDPVGTLTSKHELLDLPWEVPVRSVFSRVQIDYDTPTVTRRSVPNIVVSDSRGDTLTNGEREDKFFEPPANQDWHQVQTPQWLGGSVSTYQLRRGRGSYRGGIILTDDDDVPGRMAYSTNLTQSWQQINPQRWLLSSSVQRLAPGEYVEQRFLDDRETYGQYYDTNLPIIRAKGLVEWDSATTTSARRGPSLAPAFTHNVGPWIQSPAEIQALADWLADHLTSPDTVLKNIPIVPDPRIQLGDVFWLEDQTAYQVRLRIVIMGKTLSYQTNGEEYEMSQQITCRVIEVDRFEVSYRELESAWDGRDYESFESAWSGENYDGLESGPLDRG